MLGNTLTDFTEWQPPIKIRLDEENPRLTTSTVQNHSSDDL